MRFRNIVPIIIMLCLTVSVLAQDPNRGTAEATINGKKIVIDYGRPHWGNQDQLARAPVGMVWRLGMNKPTVIDTAGDLVVAGKELKAGKYSLWAKRTGEDSWILAFHPEVPGWGWPVKTSGFVAELPLKSGKATDTAEQLTISLADTKGKGTVKIQWGTALLLGTFDVK
jgi:hypothetical protein